MLFLRCLGSLGLSNDESLGPSAGQVRRLALLAILAANRDRPVTRDSLLAILWPESTDARARQALSQSLYALRRDLGCDTLFLGQRDLSLNPAVIDCDLWQFQQALAEDALEDAVALYRGDFLDAVHISQAERFERWADEQRATLRQQMFGTLERLGTAASDSGHHSRAVVWWTRRVALDPLSHRAALQLTHAMVAAGERAAALQFIGRHEETLREELNVGPDIALLKLRGELRLLDPGSTPAAPTVDVSALLVSAAAAPAVTDAAVDAATFPIGATPQPPSRRPAATSSWLRLIPVAVFAAIAVFLGIRKQSTLNATARTTATADPVRVVAVAPLEFVGPADGAFKARIVERLLLANIASIPRLRLARGDERDTSVVITGSVVAHNETGPIVAVARLASRGGEAIQLRATDERGDLSVVADNLTRQVIAQLARAEDVYALLASASSMTRSLAALRFFASGEELLEAARWREAEDAFAQAVRADSTFALASYRLSEAANWNGNVVIQQQAAERAWRMRAGLPARDRILIEAYWAWNSGEIDAAERGFRDAVTRYPWDTEAWYQLAEVVFHSGPVMGRPAQLATDAYVRAARPMRNRRGRRYSEALLHLERIAALSGDTVAFDSLHTRLQALASPDDRHELNALAACVRRSRTAVRELDLMLRVANGNTVLTNARRCAVYGSSIPYALTAYASVLASALDPTLALGARIEEATLYTAAANDNQAERSLAKSIGVAPATTLLLHRAMRIVQLSTTPVAQLRAYRDSLVAGWPRDIPAGVTRSDADYGFLSSRFAPFVAGLLDARIGDTTSLWSQIRRLRALSGDTAVRLAGANMAHTLLARNAISHGRPQNALAHLDSLRAVPVVTQLDYANERGHARLFRAQALQQLNQFTASAAVAQSIGQRSVFEYLLVPEAMRIATTSLERAGLRDSSRAVARRWKARTDAVGAIVP